ncbi:hypothetical protein B0F90DRAFT_1704850, partial [Multifurca ochricompacta]
MLAKEIHRGIHDRELLVLAGWYLRIAQHVMGILGREGDAGGPLEEIDILSNLINKEL